MIIPVVLCGGSGSRLWPLSRGTYPKQLLPLLGNKTMLQQTLERMQRLGLGAPILVCSAQYRHVIAEQLHELQIIPDAVLLEPVQRNTAAAVAAAALYAEKAHGPEAVLLVSPSDHIIRKEDILKNALLAAEKAAHAHLLLTFGLVPTRPETGYGYIKAGKILHAANGAQVRQIEAFVEKPDLPTAETYVQDGSYMWNSGKFLFRVDQILRSFSELAPQSLESAREALAAAKKELPWIELDPHAFASAPNLSIDTAIMEKTPHGAVIPVDLDWTDVGSWDALMGVLPSDSDGNVVLGDVVALDAQGCYLRAESRLLGVAGLQNAVVVETADAGLVTDRSNAQRVKEIVTNLKLDGRQEAHTHADVKRPWGSFRTLVSEANYKVKNLTLHPQRSISLQLHRRRSEHWVVVKGAADIIRGEERLTLLPNQSTFIPPGMKHRLMNNGDAPLEIIEVQLGDYLGEDDIERFEDDFGRFASENSKDST